MTSKTKTLIISVVVVLLLIGVVVVLKLTEPSSKDKTSSSESVLEQVSYLIDENVDNFKSLEITNQNSEYTVLFNEKSKDDTTVSKYYIDTLSQYKQDSAGIESLVNSVNKLAYTAKVSESVDDLAKYGLDNPQGTIKYKVLEKEYIIKIGNKAADKGYYAMVESDNALYTINTDVANRVLQSNLVFLSKEIIPNDTTTGQDGTSVVPTLNVLSVQRSDLNSPIKLVPNDKTDTTATYASAYKMVSPIESSISYDVDNEYIAKLFGMNAQSVDAIYDINNANQYGFDNPTATIVIEYDNSKYTITVGKKGENNEYKVLVNDNGLVYNVLEDSLVFMTVSPDDLISKIAILPSITDVASVDVNVDNQNYKFDITNETVKNDSGEETTETKKVSTNGKEIDVDNFKKYYQLLLSTSIEKINYSNEKGTLIASITYNYKNGGSEKIELYQAENRKMIVSINGEAKYEGRIAYYDKLVKETQNLLSGNDVDTNW